MAMNESDIRFGARGFSPRANLRDDPVEPLQPGLDPRLIEAIAKVLSQQGGLQQYGQGLAQGPYPQGGVLPPGNFIPSPEEDSLWAQPGGDLRFSLPQREGGMWDYRGGDQGPGFYFDRSAPNALTDGVQSDGVENALTEQSMREEQGLPDPAAAFSADRAPLAADDIEGAKTAKPKKKKGEFSEFFKLLAAAKKEDKKGSTRKAFKDLAKQLDSGNAEGTIPTS